MKLYTNHKIMEEAPGQFNFINSQLRMNENHIENQNEFEKMSLMVKNLVECKIDHIFKDINYAKEDLKMRIALAIEAHENASTLAVKIGNLLERIKNLETENVILKNSLSNINTSNASSNTFIPGSSNGSSNSDELNKAKATIEELTQKLTANSGTLPSGALNIQPNTDLKTKLDEAIEKIKELTEQLNAKQGNNGNSNNDSDNDNNNGNNTINDNNNGNNNNINNNINTGNNTLSPNDFYKMYAKQ